MIYREFKTWRIAAECSIKHFFSALYAVLFLCLIMGMVSIFLAVIRAVNAFYRRELVAGCIVTAIIVVLGVGWMVTFVKEREQRITVQHEADSLAYDLSKFTQMYDTVEYPAAHKDTIIYCP